MNSIVRPLDRDRDHNGLVSLFKSNPTTFVGYTDSTIESTMMEKLPDLLNDPLFFTLVTVVDDEIIGAFITKEFEFQPCWTWGYWVNKPGKLTKLWLEDGFNMIRSINDQLFDEMETRRGLTRFFWSFPRYPDQTGIRTAGSGERWLASNVGVKYMPRGRNYTYFDDCFIPAGQIPRYPYQKAIIGNRVWPMDIQIRMGVLNSTKGNDQNVG